MQTPGMENPELVEISINYMGNDLIAVVPLQQAQILVNDEAQAALYAQQLLQKQGREQDLYLTEDSQSGHESFPLAGNSAGNNKKANSGDGEIKQDGVFSSLEATTLFLKLRKKYNGKFDDRKTVKTTLWQRIASELKENGFDVGEGKEGAERCRQKFANLQRNYLKYIKHMKTTGSEKRDPPAFFDDMHELLGHKDKTSPPYLEDSLIDEASTSSQNNDEEGAICKKGEISDSNQIKNRFQSARTSCRPTRNFDKVLDLLKAQHEETRADKQKHIELLHEAIKSQTKQQSRFLNFLEKNSKRKREQESDSDE